MNESQRKAIAAYNDALDTTIKETKAILARLEAHRRNTTMHIHWGHASEMKDLQTQMQQVGDKMFQRGEYAPAL